MGCSQLNEATDNVILKIGYSIGMAQKNVLNSILLVWLVLSLQQLHHKTKLRLDPLSSLRIRKRFRLAEERLA